MPKSDRVSVRIDLDAKGFVDALERLSVQLTQLREVMVETNAASIKLMETFEPIVEAAEGMKRAEETNTRPADRDRDH